MQVGEIVICNEFMGVVTELMGDKAKVKNKEEKELILDIDKCTSVIKPGALACLMYNNILKKLGRT